MFIVEWVACGDGTRCSDALGEQAKSILSRATLFSHLLTPPVASALLLGDGTTVDDDGETRGPRVAHVAALEPLQLEHHRRQLKEEAEAKADDWLRTWVKPEHVEEARALLLFDDDDDVSSDNVAAEDGEDELLFDEHSAAAVDDDDDQQEEEEESAEERDDGIPRTWLRDDFQWPAVNDWYPLHKDKDKATHALVMKIRTEDYDMATVLDQLRRGERTMPPTTRSPLLDTLNTVLIAIVHSAVVREAFNRSPRQPHIGLGDSGWTGAMFAYWKVALHPALLSPTTKREKKLAGDGRFMASLLQLVDKIWRHVTRCRGEDDGAEDPLQPFLERFAALRWLSGFECAAGCRARFVCEDDEPVTRIDGPLDEVVAEAREAPATHRCPSCGAAGPLDLRCLTWSRVMGRLPPPLLCCSVADSATTLTLPELLDDGRGWRYHTYTRLPMTTPSIFARDILI